MSTIQRQPQPSSVGTFLAKQRPEFEKALPKHLDADRFLRIILTEVRKTPALERCDPQSFMASVMQAAQLGLEIGSGLGYCYLIPYGTTCQLIIGYKGLIDLARRSGELKNLTARVVYENDYFAYELGDEEKIVHRPAFGDRGAPLAAYAIAHLTNGAIQREVMSVPQIEDIRKRAKRANPVWDTDWEEMARKTVVRRIAKYLPLSPEMRDAIEAEEAEAPVTIEARAQVRRDLELLPDQPTATDAAIELGAAKAALQEAWDSRPAMANDPAIVIGVTRERAFAETNAEAVWSWVDHLSGGAQ